MRLGNKTKSLRTFGLYCTHLALSLDKIGCGSAIKPKVFGLLFCIALTLHYLCIK